MACIVPPFFFDWQCFSHPLFARRIVFWTSSRKSFDDSSRKLSSSQGKRTAEDVFVLCLPSFGPPSSYFFCCARLADRRFRLTSTQILRCGGFLFPSSAREFPFPISRRRSTGNFFVLQIFLFCVLRSFFPPEKLS